MTTTAIRPAGTEKAYGHKPGAKNFFPHLPPYLPPKTGFLSLLPASWVPYAQLMRLDRPGGFYAMYVPYLVGVAYAACIAPQTPTPSELLRLAVLLVPLSILSRGVACTWNDNVDQQFDRQVARCRHRPIARGAVSTTQANVFTLALFLLETLLFAFLPVDCATHLAITTALFLVYALMKRITYYPQVVLGLPFAWAILFAIVALGMDPFQYQVAPTMALFMANVVWTITYDTIYAHQDIADDEKAGVKGMALRFRGSTKSLASALSIIQVGLLFLCGVWAHFGVAYFVGTVGGVAASMAYYIVDVDLSSPEHCGQWFHDQFLIVGAGFLAGLLSEYALKL